MDSVFPSDFRKAGVFGKAIQTMKVQTQCECGAVIILREIPKREITCPKCGAIKRFEWREYEEKK